MRTQIVEEHRTDAEGRPAGGTTTGRGFQIEWQNGPLVKDGVRVEPTGAFVEDVIAAAIGRIEHYQESPFACSENADALAFLHGAASALERRTRNRQERGVEGTHAA